MNAIATITVLPYSADARGGRKAVVELSASADDRWLGSFTAFGRDRADVMDRAYLEADANLRAKGYALDYMREAA